MAKMVEVERRIENGSGGRESGGCEDERWLSERVVVERTMVVECHVTIVCP